MYFLLTKRVIKVAADTGGDKDAPHSTNRTSWFLGGPFRERTTPEEAAAASLSTRTCLSALVLDEVGLQRIVNANCHARTDRSLGRACMKALELLALQKSGQPI